MSISKKIEEIRRQPEHIRLCWTWFLTIFFTLCIIFSWGVSLKFQPKIINEAPNLKNEEAVFSEEFQAQKKSIEDATQELKEIYNNTQERNQ